MKLPEKFGLELPVIVEGEMTKNSSWKQPC